jgi:hypothetical protein
MVYQLVNDAHEAWHAGICHPQFDNDVSLGIECEHRSGQDWPAVQKDALAWLLKQLAATHRIPSTLIDTHGQVAIKGPYVRKNDPTNWPRPAFIAWRDQVFATTTTAHAGPYGALARQDYMAAAPAAAYFAPGTAIPIDDFYQNSYRHAASGIGFIAEGDLV